MCGYHPKLNCLFRKGNNECDPIRFVYGMTVALYQYAEKSTKQYFHYMAQYIKSQICFVDSKNEKNKNVLVDKFKEMFNMTKLYEELADKCGVDKEITEF